MVIDSQKEEQYYNDFTGVNNNKIDKIISVSYEYKNFAFLEKGY